MTWLINKDIARKFKATFSNSILKTFCFYLVSYCFLCVALSELATTMLDSHWIYMRPNDKTNKMTMRPAKTQIGLGIRPVWSESLLCAQWVAKDPSFLHADSEDYDQTGRMPRLIWFFAGRTYHFVGFIMRRLIYSLWFEILDKSVESLFKFKKWYDLIPGCYSRGRGRIWRGRGGGRGQWLDEIYIINCQFHFVMRIWLTSIFLSFLLPDSPSIYEPRHEKTCLYHPRSLISTFVVHCLDCIIPLVSILAISRVCLASVAEQTGLSLTWSKIPKTGFVVTRLLFHKLDTISRRRPKLESESLLNGRDWFKITIR